MDDAELAGGYRVTKGMSMMIPVYHIHRDPEHWPNPDTFDPERCVCLCWVGGGGGVGGGGWGVGGGGVGGSVCICVCMHACMRVFVVCVRDR